MDPTGGTDPQASTVVWSEPDDHDEGPWDIDQRTAVYAQGQAMTVFVRVISPHEAGDLPYLNYSFLDSAILAQTPQVSGHVAGRERDSQLSRALGQRRARPRQRKAQVVRRAVDGRN